MGVIKAEAASTAQIGVFSMADIERQARALLGAAKVRAERLLIEAQEEADKMKRAAHAQALAEGKKEGLAKGLEEGRKAGTEQALAEQRDQLAKLTQSLTATVNNLEASRVNLDMEARQAVVKLAIAIAERVTKRKGEFDPEVAVANLDEALHLVVHSADVRIAIHPRQHEMLQNVLPRIQAKWPELKHVELIADGTLAQGGCRIFSGGGQVDGDLQTQLDRIAAELVPQSHGQAEESH